MKRWRAGGPSETPDSNGIIAPLRPRRGRVAKANENDIIDAGIASAKIA